MRRMMLNELPAKCTLEAITATDNQKMIVVLKDILGEKYLLIVTGENIQVEIEKLKDK